MIYAFDVDGTLCQTNGMDYAAARPIQSRISQVNRLYDAGHHIVVHTARGYGDGTVAEKLWLTMQQLAQWGVRYHELHPKVAADVYVDDRAASAREFFGAS